VPVAGATALFLALRTTFDAASAVDLAAEIELRVGDERVVVTVAEQRLTMTRGDAEAPAATVTGDVPGVRAMVYRAGDVAEAVAAGTVAVAGSLVVVQRLVDAVR
jgi:alkyl sulfatase BDS1-like metallo-beta-lactamase superfamily hydrolase